MFILVKMIILNVSVKMVIVHHINTQYNIWALSCFREFFAYIWLDVWDTSKCKVASLYWFAYSSMRIVGGAQLLGCSHLVDHTSIPLMFHVSLTGQRSSCGGIQYGFMLCILSLNCYNLHIQGVTDAHFPHEVTHLTCIKILRIRPILTSKLVHENSTTNFE